jgi:Protein of unknown function (DUF2815)
MTQTTKVKVVTGKVRFSYANVFTPKASVEGGAPKYSVSIIIPKSDKETIAKLQKAFDDTKAAAAAYFGGTVPKGLKGGLRDGDEEKDDAAYAGCYFINANSAQKPGVVDADLNPILDQSEFYSGCYGRASITFYPYNAQGSKGIACGLNNVQKLEDGEKLGGATSAAADFAV